RRIRRISRRRHRLDPDLLRRTHTRCMPPLASRPTIARRSWRHRGEHGAMSDVLVLARTRMRNGNICVGAIDMETGRMIRPLTNQGWAFREHAPWTVGDIWQVEYLPQ